MATDITVSICSLTYNHSQYIRQALDSMLMQEVNFKYEIIVNDDCSTDGTTDIIREYADKYPDIIVPILHNENQFQKGMRGMFHRFLFPKARGKYIAICELDDYWDDVHKLQKQVDFLELNSEYSMCFTRAKLLLHIDTPVYLKCFDTADRDYSAIELFDEWRVPTASMLFRTSVRDYPIKNMDKMMNGDAVVVQQCAHCGKIRGMSDSTCVYRIQSSGVTYSETVNTTRVMRYPIHYECMLENFPLLKDSSLKQKLALAYYDRSGIQSTEELKKHDLQRAEFYQQGILKKMRVERLKLELKIMVKKYLGIF